MEKDLKKAVFHTKAAILIILLENKAAVRAVTTTLTGFIEKTVDFQKIFKKVYYLRSSIMFNKTFTIITGVLVLAFAAYVIAQESPYQVRPVQQWQGQQDPPWNQGPMAGRGRFQQRFGQPWQQGPVQPGGPMMGYGRGWRGGRGQQLAPQGPARPNGPMMGYGRGWRGGRGQQFAPQGPARPNGPMMGYGRGWRGGRGQQLTPQGPARRGWQMRRGGRPMPQHFYYGRGGWNWRDEFRPLPPGRFQQGRGYERQPMQPRMRDPVNRGMGSGMGPAVRGQPPRTFIPRTPQRGLNPRRGYIPEENVAPVQPQQFEWN